MCGCVYDLECKRETGGEKIAGAGKKGEGDWEWI
jgi:hypothetical protein